LRAFWATVPAAAPGAYQVSPVRWTGSVPSGADVCVTERRPVMSDSERWKERGVALRVFVYVFATHLFAGFVWLLFYVGDHAQK
jgi:hypothetical protein